MPGPSLHPATLAPSCQDQPGGVWAPGISASPTKVMVAEQGTGPSVEGWSRLCGFLWEAPAQPCGPAPQMLGNFLEPSARRLPHRAEQKAGRAGAPQGLLCACSSSAPASAQSSPGVSKGSLRQPCPRLGMRCARSWPWSSVTSCQTHRSSIFPGIFLLSTTQPWS